MPVADGSGCSGIELIVGPYRSGKTRALLEQLIARARSTAFAQLMVVVPSARYRALLEDRLYELLENWGAGQFASGPTGVFGLRIVPFYRLCRNILESAGQPVRVVPDAVRPALVSQVIGDLHAEGGLRSLAPIARFPGTSAAVLQLIDEFQRAGFSPDEVRIKLEETAAAESRYLELARIYERYWAALDDMGYLDQRRLAFAARETLFQDAAVETVADPRFAFASAVALDFLAVDGFDRINRLQAQVLLGLSRQSAETEVVFDYPGEDSGDGHLAEYLWKKSSFDELVRTLQPTLVTRGNPPSPPAGGLADGQANDELAETPEKKIISVLDRFMEMQEVARSCKASLVRSGRAAGDILVVARDLKVYRGAIEAAFDEAAIPYFIDESVSLRALPLAQFVLTLVKLSVEEFHRSLVLEVLRSPYLDLKKVGLGRSDVETIENYSWEQNVVAKRDQWDRTFADPKWDRIRIAFEQLFDQVTPPAMSRHLTDFVSWTEDLLEKLVRLPSGGGTSDTESDDDAQVLSSLRDILRSLVLEDAILSGRLHSFEGFLTRFESLIDSGNFRRRRQWKDCVTICGADLAPNKMYDEVFVAGMIEGQFPRRSGQSGFVGREELLRWSGFGIDINNPRDHPGFEPALYASLLSRARKRVQLSFPQYEMDGEELVPSFFIAEDLAAGELNRVPPFVESLVDPLSPRDAFISRLWHVSSTDTSRILRDHPGAEFLRDRLDAPLSMARGRVCGKLESVYNGFLVDLVKSGSLRVELPVGWSASKLNAYGQCPFKYWVSNSLELQPHPETAAGVGRDKLGAAYHKALEHFYRSIVETGDSITTIDPALRDSLLTHAAEEALSALEGDEKVTVGDFWEYEKREFHFRLRRFVGEEIRREQIDEEGFRPSAFEVYFSDRETAQYPPLVIDSSRGPVVLRGIVDRIDVTGEGTARFVRVVDYKTGSRTIKAKDAYDGRNLQLPLYALAAERVLLPGSRVARGVYLSINSGESVGKLDFGDTASEDLRRRTEELVAKFVESIGSGDFTVRPTDAGMCGVCDHKNICRVDEISQEEQPDEQPD